MNFKDMKEKFEKEKSKIYESVKVTFVGVDGFDVYNPSIPFTWEGSEYIYGRVEKRDEWATSHVRLFKNAGKDVWKVVENSPIYTLEDPYIMSVNDEIILGGTHVQKENSEVSDYFGYFFRGTDLNNLVYFTTGPPKMKDIRLVNLKDKIGVFSRPRGEDVREEHGSESIVGYTEIDSLSELTSEKIAGAKKINNLFGKDEWGGCNQVYELEDGCLGVIGHISFTDKDLSVYMNMSFVFNKETHQASELKVIGTRKSYPDGPSKLSRLKDCVFTAGIVKREDGKCDLYSGLGDVEVGRITIDNPFLGHGKILY